MIRLAVFALLALPLSAHAAPAYEFGRMAIGTPVEAAPAWAAWSTCDDAKSLDDCTFADDDGVTYSVFEHHLTGKSIEADGTTKLPFGLTAHDTAKIIAALSKRLGIRLVKKPGSSEYTSPRLDVANFNALHLSVDFDKAGHLSAVYLADDLVEN